MITRQLEHAKTLHVISETQATSVIMSMRTIDSTSNSAQSGRARCPSSEVAHQEAIVSKWTRAF